jgi:hypothetical protein
MSAATQQFDFSGTWKSVFTYVNSTEPDGGVSEYEVRLHQTGSQLVMQSVPGPTGNYFVARLTLDGSILTGTWQENASPTGMYEGRIYNGAGQLLIDEGGATMRGKIVEYNNDMDIITGDWKLERIAEK